MFFAVSVLAGLLLSGLAVPLTALAGGGVNLAADSLDDIPADLATPPQSQRSRVLMANGKELTTFYAENRVYVPLSKIAPVMQEAQIAIEDHRFYEHGAIDFQGFGRALIKTLTGDTQGASTLTQQYVKLVRVETAAAANDREGVRKAIEVTPERKIIEMRYAMALEDRLTKDQILERYLNIAYYGDGAYGVEAAARHYFGTTAAKLTLPQAAMLAGIVQNPVSLNPVKHTERAIDRRDVVLNQMVKWGMITEQDAVEAKQETFDPAKVRRAKNGCIDSKYPFLCDYVRRTLLQLPSMGETQEERENMLKRGGLTIQTMIDPEAQDAAEKAVGNIVAPKDPVIGASVLIQPKTGLIVAMAQSRPKMGDGKGETWYNYNVSNKKPDMGGAEGYQAGSTFKTFTMAAALDMGMTPGKQYNAPGRIDLQGMTFKNCKGPFVFRQDHAVGNLGYTNYGMIDMMKAAQSSVNTYFMQLVRDVGICSSIDMAKKAGVKASMGTDLRSEQNYPVFVLGTADVTPLSMAEAYATFANRGKHCNPIILESVKTADGKKIEVPDANCKQVIRKEVADGVNYILESVAKQGTGRPAAILDGRDEAGKTGTTNENKSVWYAGYTPEMAGIGMIALDKAHKDVKSKKVRSLKNLSLERTYLRGTGGGDAGKIWNAAMKSALRDLPKTSFKAPTKEILQGVKVKIPDVRGMGYDQARRTLEAAGFTTQRLEVFSSWRPGTFLGTAPTGQAVKFSTIQLKVSKGPEPEPEPTVPDDKDKDGRKDKKPDDKKPDDNKKPDKKDPDD
ncbi:MAG: transglycosylase domain-containing protein [Tessaracoccus sp.]|nr:transglycosylase domain-containing protein [Tessaracoccus sp.]